MCTHNYNIGIDTPFADQSQDEYGDITKSKGLDITLQNKEEVRAVLLWWVERFVGQVIRWSHQFVIFHHIIYSAISAWVVLLWANLTCV